jgi:hypothetical protein
MITGIYGFLPDHPQRMLVKTGFCPAIRKTLIEMGIRANGFQLTSLAAIVSWGQVSIWVHTNRSRHKIVRMCRWRQQQRFAGSFVALYMCTCLW